MAYQAEKALRDLGDKAPAGKRSEIEKKIAELRQAIQGEDLARIRSLTQDLQSALSAVGQQAYQQTPPTSGGPTDPTQGNGGNGRNEGAVVEGEFHEA